MEDPYINLYKTIVNRDETQDEINSRFISLFEEKVFEEEEASGKVLSLEKHRQRKKDLKDKGIIHLFQEDE